MTQVCRNLWLVELFIFVFMYLYSSGLQKFWSAGQQLMRIFFLLNFLGFLVSWTIKTDDCGSQKISKQFNFVAGRLKIAALVQKP